MAESCSGGIAESEDAMAEYLLQDPTRFCYMLLKGKGLDKPEQKEGETGHQHMITGAAEQLAS